jgi:hypothetical protein
MLLCNDRVCNRSAPMNDDARTGDSEGEFAGWHVWESNTGRWWAARKATLTAAQSSAGCAQYLEADSPGELRDQIAAEEALSTRLASGLPSVDRYPRRESHDG